MFGGAAAATLARGGTGGRTSLKAWTKERPSGKREASPIPTSSDPKAKKPATAAAMTKPVEQSSTTEDSALAAGIAAKRKRVRIDAGKDLGVVVCVLPLWEGDHNDQCERCNKGGKLLCCDFCNTVWHLDCLDPPLTEEPDGDWPCPCCREEIITRKRAAFEAAKRRRTDGGGNSTNGGGSSPGAASLAPPVYRGVKREPQGWWRAFVGPDDGKDGKNGKNTIHIGLFRSAEDAARAHDRQLRKQHEESGRAPAAMTHSLNFPDLAAPASAGAAPTAGAAAAAAAVTVAAASGTLLNGDQLSVPGGASNGVQGIHPCFQQWRGELRWGNAERHLGYFDTVEAAASAYNRASRFAYGAQAQLNTMPWWRPAVPPAAVPAAAAAVGTENDGAARTATDGSAGAAATAPTAAAVVDAAAAARTAAASPAGPAATMQERALDARHNTAAAAAEANDAVAGEFDADAFAWERDERPPAVPVRRPKNKAFLSQSHRLTRCTCGGDDDRPRREPARPAPPPLLPLMSSAVAPAAVAVVVERQQDEPHPPSSSGASAGAGAGGAAPHGAATADGTTAASAAAAAAEAAVTKAAEAKLEADATAKGRLLGLQPHITARYRAINLAHAFAEEIYWAHEETATAGERAKHAATTAAAGAAGAPDPRLTRALERHAAEQDARALLVQAVAAATPPEGASRARIQQLVAEAAAELATESEGIAAMAAIVAARAIAAPDDGAARAGAAAAAAVGVVPDAADAEQVVRSDRAAAKRVAAIMSAGQAAPAEAPGSSYESCCSAAGRMVWDMVTRIFLEKAEEEQAAAKAQAVAEGDADAPLQHGRPRRLARQ
ncbi:unnamed protein product, partial [Phaeothamnion confervicola]